MQRKNNLLSTTGFILTSSEHFFTKNIPSRQSSSNNRPAFAMIMAVVVMIVVATIMMFTLKQTTQTAKRTADMYLYEQSILHTKSAIEYALFRIAQNDLSTGCININNLPLTLDTIYDINITMRYVFNPPIVGCNSYMSTIVSSEQNGSVLMDIRVRVDANVTGSEPITYFRRTIQKL